MTELEQGKVLKRRGILAAAGAAVAGLVAKQASTPVAAAFALQGDFDNPSTANTNIHGGGAVPPWASTRPINPVFSVQCTVTTHDAIAAKTTGVGGTGGSAFYGETVDGFALQAIATGAGNAVDATAYAGNALVGQTTNGMYGVYGYTQNGISGVFGIAASADTGSAGVFGSATNGSGVFGATSGSGLVAGVLGQSGTAYGVLGRTTALGYSGLAGTTNTPGTAALAATSTTPSAFAAYFQGFTYVQGDFAVSGNKSAVVPHPDGTHRLLYCVESPEAWFEDFGEGKIVGGRADVKLDPDFAALVHGDTFLVFVTGSDKNGEGLVVTAKRADGFVVEERKGGKGSSAFAWRAVAKRKDNPGKRLERFALPKINAPDPDKLPKPVLPKKP